MKEQINYNFSYHAPQGDQIERYNQLRKEARVLAHLIDDFCADGREKSLAITKLEEAVMWANASVAREV